MFSTRIKRLCAAALVLSCSALFAQNSNTSNAPTKWTPEVMIKYHRLTNAAISPEGKWVAYTVSEPLLEGEKSEFRTHIFLASADGKVDFQFTQGEKSCTNPQCPWEVYSHRHTSAIIKSSGAFFLISRTNEAICKGEVQLMPIAAAWGCLSRNAAISAMRSPLLICSPSLAVKVNHATVFGNSASRRIKARASIPHGMVSQARRSAPEAMSASMRGR